MTYPTPTGLFAALLTRWRTKPTPARVVRIGYRLQRFIALTTLRASLARLE